MEHERSPLYGQLTQATDYYILDKEWNSDFDITDQDLDPIYIQAKAYQECMKETGDDRDTSAEGFFKALDEKCSEYAPDLVKVDQFTLKQELLYHDMDAENIDWIHFDESLKHLDIKDGIAPKV